MWERAGALSLEAWRKVSPLVSVPGEEHRTPVTSDLQRSPSFSGWHSSARLLHERPLLVKGCRWVILERETIGSVSLQHVHPAEPCSEPRVTCSQLPLRAHGGCGSAEKAASVQLPWGASWHQVKLGFISGCTVGPAGPASLVRRATLRY